MFPTFLLAASGGALLCLTLADLIKTTITLRGAGPITSRVSVGIWRLLTGIDKHFPRLDALVYAAPIIALTTLAGWVLLEWAAWSLIFMAGSPGVVESQSGQPADVWARIYYAGYSFFTLGLGDYKPDGTIWQILTNLAAASGFLTVSLSATYMLQVVSAAVRKRQAAVYIAKLGQNPWHILVSGWNGKDFSALGQHLTSLAPTIIEVGEQHLAYPVLHFYHSGDRNSALPVQIAVLGEAITLVECGVHPDHRVAPSTLAVVAGGIDFFLTSLERMHIREVEAEPPAPSLEPLKRVGMPVVSEAEFHRSLKQRAERRRFLLSLVQDANRRWDTVTEGSEETCRIAKEDK